MRFFEIEESRQIIHIRLNRPEKINALHGDMLREFASIVKDTKNKEQQIVILSGAGKGFCAGGDVSMMKEVGDPEVYDRVMDEIETIAAGLYTMPKLVIAALHGPVVGLGLSIALAADYLIAEENTKISMNFIGVGLAPDGGGHFFLEQRLGTHRAKHFAWKGEQLSAKEAQELQLVDLVFQGDIHQAAEKLAAEWTARPLQSMIATKKIYNNYSLGRLLQYLSKERQSQWKLRHTADHKEGIQAFLEKRKPKFSGH
ncbi:enoyl-CoA hydratase [Halobacillus sp. Marseille-Q1614]|uniref:enoyl-CoA hydratase n=1 Tax=Halobacillus sp. Marseille-Q1614 TaxID=2709134 RepID=UPI00156E722C|nr:enoyl-CoA hydratase [Halobacillus sp. Marseille-Q1614]